ncbi:sphingomyelin phosphodiesterase [Amycolatopsis sp. NPDC059657]|uniref:sphingomyelin phosphodiesterase n=1 Tax=Amycolatopsis sp. NPDC059657 TaxID=3346899 RepID=UPI003670D417
MRKLGVLGAVVLSVTAALFGFAMPAHAAGELNVLAFNLWQLPWIANPNTSDKEARARAAESVIRARDADVVVLSEAFSAQAEDLRARLANTWPHQTPLVGQYCSTSSGWTTVDGNCSSSPFIISGGVTVLSKYPITEKHQLVYRNSLSGTWDNWSNKGAALVRIAANGRPLWIAGTHMQADEGPETLPKAHQTRMAQLAELRDLVAKYAPADEPVGIAGDLNIEYFAGQRRTDAQGRTQVQQGEAALGGTLRTADGYTYDAVTNPKAAPAGYRDALDYIGSVSGRVPAGVGPVRVVHYDGGTIPSDHYPVEAKLQY